MAVKLSVAEKSELRYRIMYRRKSFIYSTFKSDNPFKVRTQPLDKSFEMKEAERAIKRLESWIKNIDKTGAYIKKPRTHILTFGIKHLRDSKIEGLAPLVYSARTLGKVVDTLIEKNLPIKNIDLLESVFIASARDAALTEVVLSYLVYYAKKKRVNVKAFLEHVIDKEGITIEYKEVPVKSKTFPLTPINLAVAELNFQAAEIYKTYGAVVDDELMRWLKGYLERRSDFKELLQKTNIEALAL